jgi:hypothetical protein
VLQLVAGHISPSVARKLLAQNIRQEDQQLAQRGDVRHPSGRDVLDPADHAARRLGARIELEDERSVG